MQTSGSAQTRGRWRDKVSSLIRRQGRTGDNIPVTTWAYMRGARPSKPSWEAFAPSAIGLLWVALVLVRYRLVYRGQWVIEIQRTDSDHIPICSAVAPDRAVATAAIEELLVRFPSTRIDAVPTMLVALAAEGFKLNHFT